MGTLYYAVGKNNRQAIELGKGWHWPECLTGKKFDEGRLYQALTDHYTEEAFVSISIEDLDLKYIKGLVSKFLAIDTEFEVVSEHDSSSKYLGVVITDTVYIDDRTYVGHFLSDHLSD